MVRRAVMSRVRSMIRSVVMSRVRSMVRSTMKLKSLIV